MTEPLLPLLSGDLRRNSSNTMSRGGGGSADRVVSGCAIYGSVGTGGPACVGGKVRRKSLFEISRGNASFSDFDGVSFEVCRVVVAADCRSVASRWSGHTHRIDVANCG